MDSFDAVREQLSGAQSRAVDVLRDRLGPVVEALEQASRSLRESLAEPPDQLLQLTEVEVALGELEQAAAAPAGISLELLRRLDAQVTQSELLHELLAVLTDHAARAVVLVIRAGTVSAWSGVGFADGRTLHRWQGELSGSRLLREFVEQPVPLRFDPEADPLVASWIAGEARSEQALLVPVTLRGKLMGAFYADRLPGSPWNPDMIQALVAIGCWLIDTLHHRSPGPTPMLAQATDAELAPEPVRAPEEPAESMALEIEEPALEGELELAEPVEAAPPEVAVEAGPTFDPSRTLQVDLNEVIAEPVVAAPAPTEELEFEIDTEGVAPVATAVPPSAVRGAPVMPSVMPPVVSPVTPPADLRPIRPVAAPRAAPQLTAEEETRHEEARRFARLLVSEIKLYNEEEVERGRAQRDLYRRLKEDIDRSREMYEKRISPDIRAARDYFHEELVRILAGNDPDALGV